MTYNRSEIMKRAWEIKKENEKNIFGACLKMAWAEVKGEIKVNNAEKTEKEMLIDRLNFLAADGNELGCGYIYEISISEWNNYGKSRTYFSIIETRHRTRHYKKLSYGYYDNIAGKYVPERSRDLTSNYNVWNRAMQ